MIPHLSHVMTLANSVIGVSVLAMPFCFKQCGIVLATLVLLLSSALSRLACHFLIKSAVMSRRRNFEFLAFHAFGRTGKFFVELFIIGFLLGTCIAFFVVVGDLGPEIVGKLLNQRPEDIRTSLLVTTGTFIVLPLGLLRNIDSLSSVCTATIGFYLCLVVKVIGESTRHIFLGDWYNRVMYWRPGGILQCLPIFAMALFCQTQLFDIYEAIPNVCLEKMNQVVRGALNICTMVYLCVGFFGYVAFCTQPFTGNILMSFEPSLTSDLIKMGFVFSVAFSFPLVIFPCRASLNSLLFRRAHTHEPSNYYIPEMRFRCLTVAIVAMSLGTGILIPNIEFVLGIVGSTIGVMICLIFPAAFFIAISTKNTNERLMAQAILLFGMSIMVLGTYANLYATEDPSTARGVFIATGEPLDRMSDILPFKGLQNLPNVLPQLETDPKIIENYKEKIDNPLQQVPGAKVAKTDVRREPPIPMERSVVTDGPVAGAEKPRVESVTPRSSVKDLSPALETSKASAVPVEGVESPIAQEPKIGLDHQRNENLIDSDAIKKEESELAAAGDQAEIEAAARHEKLRQTLEKHKLEQLEMMQEQKELLKDIRSSLKEQAQVLEMEKKRLAKEQNRRKDESVEANKSPSQTRVLDEGKIENETGGAKSNGKVRSRDSRGPILNALTNGSRRNETRAEEAKKSLEFALPIALQMRNQTNGEEKSSPRGGAGADGEERSPLTAKVERVDRSALTGRGDGREDLVKGDGREDLVKGNDRENLVKGNDLEDLVKGNDLEDLVKGNDREDLVKGNDREDLVKGNDREDLVKGNDREDLVKGNDREDLPVKGNDREDLPVKGNDREDLVKGNDREDLPVKGNDREDGSSLTVKGDGREDGSSLTVKGKSNRVDRSSLTGQGNDQEDLTVKGKSDRVDRSSLTGQGNDQEDLTVKGKSNRVDRSSLTGQGNDQEDLTVKGKRHREDGSSLTVKDKSDREDGSSLTVKDKSDREDGSSLTVKGKSDRQDGSSLTVKGNDREDLSVKGNDREDVPVKGNDQEDLPVKGNDREDLPVKGNDLEDLVKGDGREDLTVKGNDREDGSSLTVKGNSDREEGSSLTVKGNDREDGSSLRVKGNNPKDGSSLTVKGNNPKDGSPLTVKGNSDREDRSSSTAKDNDRKAVSSLTVKANAERAAMRREILEQPEFDRREKRDVVDEAIPEGNFDVPERPVEECRRKVDDVKEATTNIPTTEIISIKTNVYLADQGFTDKKVSLDPVDSADQASSGLSVLKKRDLKALIRERRR